MPYRLTIIQRKASIQMVWIARINAAARQNGLSYQQIYQRLEKASVEIRPYKILADIAVFDKVAFAALVEKQICLVQSLDSKVGLKGVAFYPLKEKPLLKT